MNKYKITLSNGEKTSVYGHVMIRDEKTGQMIIYFTKEITFQNISAVVPSDALVIVTAG